MIVTDLTSHIRDVIVFNLFSSWLNLFFLYEIMLCPLSDQHIKFIGLHAVNSITGSLMLKPPDCQVRK